MTKLPFKSQILVVGSDVPEPIARCIGRKFRQRHVVTVSEDPASAITHLRARYWSGVAVVASDALAEAVPVLRKVYAREPGLRAPGALLLTADPVAVDKAVVRWASRVGGVVVKPEAPEPQVRRFLMQAVASDHLSGRARVEVAVQAASFDLSAAETRILALAVAGHSQKTWAEVLGVRHSSVRTHIARMLRKMGAKSVRAAAAPILQRLLGRAE